VKADIDTLIERLIDPRVRAAAPYHVADAAGMVKLDAMENPYDWPVELRVALSAKLQEAAFNRYPDPQAVGVKRGLRRAMNIDPRWDILLGNGSDEIIQLLILALACQGGTVLAPAPTFVMFGMIAGWLQADFAEVPLTERFDLDRAAMLSAIAQRKPRLVFLASPNNPTGNLFDESALRAVLEASEGVVVIDEAYTAFTDSNHLQLLDEYPNLLIMRTLSKLGMAGLRLGYLVGDSRWIVQLDKLRLPYNIGALNQLAAEVALEHFELLRRQTDLIRTERDRLQAILQADTRLQCFPSEANFLLLRFLDGSATAIHQRMRQRGVLVKCLDAAHPLLRNCLRLTVGTPAENSRMLDALGESRG
jgi:histidinol-phosphate aminotransferase